MTARRIVVPRLTVAHQGELDARALEAAIAQAYGDLRARHSNSPHESATSSSPGSSLAQQIARAIHGAASGAASNLTSGSRGKSG